MPISSWKFFSWAQKDDAMIIAVNQEYPQKELFSVDLSESKAKVFNFPEALDEDASLRALAYSPGKELAYAVVYPRRTGIRDIEIAKIYMENKEMFLTEIKGGASFVGNSIKWSPNAKRFIWIVKIIKESGESQILLWIADTNGDPKVLYVLGHSVEYIHPAVWSMDGSMIAFLKVEGTKGSKESANNIYIINPDTGDEKQLTFFKNQRLSHLQWSPDGNWLSFTLSKVNYGEIWVTNSDGSVQYPIAGPTLSDAPYIWLIEDE